VPEATLSHTFLVSATVARVFEGCSVLYKSQVNLDSKLSWNILERFAVHGIDFMPGCIPALSHCPPLPSAPICSSFICHPENLYSIFSKFNRHSGCEVKQKNNYCYEFPSSKSSRDSKLQAFLGT
jgi:hypothetical protein